MKLQGYYKYILLIILCNSLYGFSQSTSLSTQIDGIDAVSVLRTVNPVSTTHNGETVSGKYLTILGKGHATVVNPFIITEGIDPENVNYFDSHIELFNNKAPRYSGLIYSLYINVYDVIILDYDNSTREIQDNAMLLVQLINDIYNNNSLTDDNFVVMGYSMGGLVARYALTWMEANSQNHHTRLFVSHDAPQKGANFPLGLQELLQDIMTNSGGAFSIAVNLLFMTLHNNLPATEQMQIYHFINSKDGVARPSDKGVSFFSELYNLSPSTNGYPARPVKIATSNGNYSGIKQKDMATGAFLNPGDKILDFYYTKDNGYIPSWLRIDCACNLLQWIFGTCPDCPPVKDAPDEISVTVRAGFDGSQPLDNFFMNLEYIHPVGNTGQKLWGSGSAEQTFFSSNLAYDIAPGSYSPSYMNAIKNEITNALGVPVTAVNTTCFIPTISALDLNVGINDSFDLNNSQCYTNFDYIYANSLDNKDHWNLEPGAKQFIMDHVLAVETPRQKYFFNAENFIIPANQIVGNGEQYNKTAKYTMTNDGTFIVNTGASSTLVAGQSIEMKSGFSVETGGLYSATIGYIDLMCENPVKFIPRQLAKGLIPDPSNTSIQKSYDCSNYTEIPSYNPDYSYFDCDSTLNQISTESVDSLLNTMINIYPNPTTSGIMNIQLAQEIPTNDITIRIFDYFGNLIYTIDPVTSSNLSFNLPNCMPGLLTVQFIFNNANYVYSRKILKQ